MYIVIKINSKEKLTTEVEIKHFETKEKAIDYIKQEFNLYCDNMYQCGGNITYKKDTNTFIYKNKNKNEIIGYTLRELNDECRFNINF